MKIVIKRIIFLECISTKYKKKKANSKTAKEKKKKAEKSGKIKIEAVVQLNVNYLSTLS